MSEIEDKISAVLSNPEAMSKVMEAVKSLTGSSSDSGTESVMKREDRSDSPLQGLLGGMDPKTMGSIMKLLGAYSGGDDRRLNLLTALKPYLRRERQDSIDRALQIMKLAKVAQVAMDEFIGGDRHRV